MDMSTKSRTEATMSVRVIRKNGKEESYLGDEIDVNVDEIIAEYKATVNRALMLEEILKQIPNIQERMK